MYQLSAFAGKITGFVRFSAHMVSQPVAPPRPDRRQLLGGILAIAASAASFGAMPIFARHAYAHGVDTSVLLSWRFLIAAIVLALVVFARGSAWPRGRQLAGLMAMGGAGYVGQAYCYFSALHHAEPGLVAILLYLYPFFVAVLASRVLRQPLGLPRWLMLGVALTGAVLTIGGGRGDHLGVMLGVGAAVIYALYIIAGARLTQGVDAVAASAVVCSSAAFVYWGVLGVRVLSGEQLAMPGDAVAWGNVVAIAVLSTAVAVLGFFYGMRMVGPTAASMLSTVEPLFTMVLAWAMLGEAVTAIAALGAALTLAAVLALAWWEGRRLPGARA